MKRLLLLTIASLLLFFAFSCGEAVADTPTETEGSTQGITETVTEAPSEYDEPIDYGKAVTKDLIHKVLQAEYSLPRNLILVIGDGMGPNDIAIAEKYGELEEYGLILNHIVNNGHAYTRSASHSVTDSAASGTALSTGKKTNNGMIGRDPDGTDLNTMAEFARSKGKLVGIVTDDELYGATPSSFVAHSDSRYNYEELAAGIVSFAPDLIIGKSFDSLYEKLTPETRSVMRKTYNIGVGTETFGEKLAACNENAKGFAGFNGGCRDVLSAHLADSTVAALQYLDNEKGFFLLIEGAGTDVYGHANNMQGKIASVINLDRAISKILLFMEKNPDTLLVITSDHETGGVKLPSEGEKPTDELFTSTSHTSKNVRVFAIGKGSAFFKNNTVDNTDISKFIRSAMEG